MLLSNPFKPDPRVYEEAKALVEEGYKVTILAWDRELRFPEREMVEGIEVLRIRVRGGYGRVKEFLPGFVRFYREALKRAKSLDFDAVHAHDFDTLPLGLRVARSKKVPLVYDVHDDYASMIAESVPKVVAGAVDIVHRIAARFADRVVYANEALQRILGREGTVVMNCKDPEYYELDVEELREKLGVKGFTIVYVGIFRQIEFLRLLIEAVKRSNVYLVLGGDGPYREEVLNMIEGEERIKYVGWVKADDIPRYTKLASLIIVLNDPKKRYDRISTPVKLFEAMAAGVPVIMARGTEAGRIVEEENCGLTVEFGNVDELVEAIEEIKKYGEEMGKNGKEAAKRKYNRKLQMQNLKGLYAQLFS